MSPTSPADLTTDFARWVGGRMYYIDVKLAVPQCFHKAQGNLPLGDLANPPRLNDRIDPELIWELTVCYLAVNIKMGV